MAAGTRAEDAGVWAQLLVRDPQARLGSSHRDAEDIKRHVYFRGIDWDALLRREVTPPYTPTVVRWPQCG
jgi:hypothetical protein